MNKPSVAIVRGKFLNWYDMQSFVPLMSRYQLAAFASLSPLHDQFPFPVVKLMSPMDFPDFPYKMPVFNRVFTDAQYLLGLEKSLRGFDIAHTAETYFRYTKQCLDAKKLGRVRKVVATVWETIAHNNEGIRGRLAYKARAVHELDHIIAVTQKAKRALIAEGADAEKISVIGAHIDTNRFVPFDPSFRLVADKKKRAFTVLFCGRLVWEKGVEDLLRSAEILAQDPGLSAYRLQFRFVGDGPFRQVIVRHQRNIRKNWHSTVESATYDQMPGIYQAADLFVAPSKPTNTWEEQYGMALLEAQSCGLPIITTRCGGVEENVKDAAVLIPPGSPDAIAGALREFILTPAKREIFARRARERAIRVHDIGVGAKQLDRVYGHVLSS